MRENIKENILKTAQELFNEKGYQDTTMREIADYLGISLGNLTYHYHKKEEMMVELLKRPSFLEKEPAKNFNEFFQLIQDMLDSLMVNRFFYTVEELARTSESFYQHNTNTINEIENHLEDSLQLLSDQNFLVAWRSNHERHAFAHVIMNSHLTWIKNNFYLLEKDQDSYHDFLTMHWYLLESHVKKGKEKAYQDCFHKFPQ